MGKSHFGQVPISSSCFIFYHKINTYCIHPLAGLYKEKKWLYREGITIFQMGFFVYIHMIPFTLIMILSYFDGVADGIEYLIALGSIIGLLGFIVSLFFLLISSSKSRNKFLVSMIVCIVLLAVCGIQTGIQYFHLDL